jgi:hypothetical protein
LGPSDLLVLSLRMEEEYPDIVSWDSLRLRLLALHLRPHLRKHGNLHWTIWCNLVIVSPSRSTGDLPFNSKS